MVTEGEEFAVVVEILTLIVEKMDAIIAVVAAVELFTAYLLVVLAVVR